MLHTIMLSLMEFAREIIEASENVFGHRSRIAVAA
jgi:hypothetical protein